MKMIIRAVYRVIAILVFALMTYLPAHAQNRIEDRFANVNGVRLHYLLAGKGDPVILLHGYAQNSHMWRPLIPQLAKNSYGDCARSSWIWSIVQADDRLR